MKRAVIALLIAAFTASAAFGFGLARQGVGTGKLGASSKAGPAAVAQTGDLLLVDGVSLLLQTDGASFVCVAAGC